MGGKGQLEVFLPRLWLRRGGVPRPGQGNLSGGSRAPFPGRARGQAGGRSTGRGRGGEQVRLERRIGKRVCFCLGLQPSFIRHVDLKTLI